MQLNFDRIRMSTITEITTYLQVGFEIKTDVILSGKMGE